MCDNRDLGEEKRADERLFVLVSQAPHCELGGRHRNMEKIWNNHNRN